MDTVEVAVMRSSAPRRVRMLLPGFLLVALGCGDAVEPSVCGDAQAISIEGGNCLVLGNVQGRAEAIERVVRETVIAVRPLIAADAVRIRFESNPAGAISEIGIGGRAIRGEEVLVSIDPGFPDLDQSLETELLPLLAHELHHIARQRTVGYGTTLLEAMVTEGLADHFSIEVAGVAPPPWATALSGTELDTWRMQAAAEWTNDSYNHNAWFYGSPGGIPRWTGYTIGFVVVQEFLDANPGRRPSGLVDEPAASFVP